MYMMNVTGSNTTNQYNNITNNCTDNEKKISIIVPTILL